MGRPFSGFLALDDHLRIFLGCFDLVAFDLCVRRLLPDDLPKSRKEIKHTARPTCNPTYGGGFEPWAKPDAMTGG